MPAHVLVIVQADGALGHVAEEMMEVIERNALLLTLVLNRPGYAARNEPSGIVGNDRARLASTLFTAQRMGREDVF